MILQPSDLIYQGSFTSDLHYISGLSFRLQGGTKYLYTIKYSETGRGNTYAIPIPSDELLTKSTPYYSIGTTGILNYGDIFQDKLVDTNANGSGGEPPYVGVAGNATIPSQVFWDEIDQRMYWIKTIGYENAGDPISSSPAIGYSTLNDSLYTGTGSGSWKLDEPYPSGDGNRWAFSMAHIPAAYQSALGGRRFVVGFGGGVSVLSFGPVSHGPAAYAIHPPSLANEDHLDYMSTEPQRLISHLAGVESKCLRNASMPGLDLRNTPNTIDKWFDEDVCFHGTWIDYGNKKGVLFFSRMGGGNCDATVTEIISTSQIVVSSVGDVVAGDVVKVDVTNPSNPSYDFEQRRVQSVVGTTITFTTPVTEGMFLGGKFQAGSWYYGGGPSFSKAWTPLYIYDPDALINSYLDPITYPPSSVLPTSSSNFAVPNVTYPMPGTLTGGASENTVIGCVFDQSTGRLYIGTLAPSTAQMYIHIYQISSTLGQASLNGSGQIPLSGSGTMTLQ